MRTRSAVRDQLIKELINRFFCDDVTEEERELMDKLITYYEKNNLC